MLFKSISELMPANGTVQMALTVKDGRMTVGLVPMFDGDDSPMVPLSMTGTPEEIDEKFVAAIREFTPAVQVVSENFEQARIAAEAKAAELKAKAEKSAKAASAAKGGSKPGANDIDARKDAPLDESHAAILATVPVTDTNFASALKAASQASLDAALNDPRLTTVGGLQAVAKELAKFRDETADKLLIPVLIAKVRAAENGVREALGKALEKASGKTLNGGVCLGSARIERGAGEGAREHILDAENAFFLSQFSHLIGADERMKGMKLHEAWLIAQDKPFPTERIISSGTTLATLLTDLNF